MNNTNSTKTLGNMHEFIRFKVRTRAIDCRVVLVLFYKRCELLFCFVLLGLVIAVYDHFQLITL